MSHSHSNESFSNSVHQIFIFGTFLADVGGQRCPDSVRIYCAVSVSQYLRDLYLKFSVGRVFECPDFEFDHGFDLPKIF